LLRRAINETDGLLESLHVIARKVRPRVLDELGLYDAVESLIEEFELRTGVDVNSELRFGRDRIPTTIGENVFRILQEALKNVASHAQVGEVEVIIETDDEHLILTVVDAGVGFESLGRAASKRLGLLGMRERAELLEGQFELASSPGDGTRINVVIPLPSENKH
jgi:signal transduction histidine kinase